MIQKDFGFACKKIRESKGLSQEKFALLIDMDRTYYNKLMLIRTYSWGLGLASYSSLRDSFSCYEVTFVKG